MDSHRLDCVLPRLPTLSPGNVCRKQNGRYFHSGRHRPVSMHALHYGKCPVSSKNNISSSSTLVGGSIDADQYYSIDGKVGCSITRQLRSGSKLQIGRNGELQSETMRVKEWRHPSKKRDTIEDALRNFHQSPIDKTKNEMNKPACLIPLDWSEQVDQPDVKVLGISKPTTPPSRPYNTHRNLCESDAKSNMNYKRHSATWMLPGMPASSKQLDKTMRLVLLRFWCNMDPAALKC
ncbi:hypothetical protein BSL78_27852 [Apostichopus japonicus]|uniref:Uncharacterized protein n=1 Tax=Stichopus japonicus TaxID=307972 RepID=A0A2G8JHT2_STIJA|nr:hypothetical protein BSL78_27852 [Apostichopus japonicus]